jgi:uncharacterized protein YegP (UPF0339 family)
MFFECYQSKKDGKFRWRLKGGNGEPIASGQGYKHEQGRVNVIKMIDGGRNLPVKNTEK